MSAVEDEIRRAEEVLRAEERDRRAEAERRAAEAASRNRDRDEFLADNCRRADAHDYAGWLTGYIRKGGRITHPYDYQLPSHFYVLLRDAPVPPMFGSFSISLIVPKGQGWTARGKSNNTLYLMDGFYVDGRVRIVPLYTDVAELMMRMERQ